MVDIPRVGDGGRGERGAVNVTGLGAAKKNHTFDAQTIRLRHEEKKRKDRREPPMTIEEKVDFLKTDPWGAFSSLDPEEQEWLYLAESKTVVWKQRRKNQQDLKVYMGRDEFGLYMGPLTPHPL